MMVRGSVPSLIQGISQQVPHLRPPSYIEAGTNVYGTVVEGFTRRPAADFIAKLVDIGSPIAKHWIDRDNGERYFVAVTGGQVKVWDFEGNPKTVNAPDGWDYLDGATSVGLRTVNDYTFVWNRDTVVEMASTVEPAETSRGMAWVRQGDYSTTYSVRVGYPATSPSWYTGSYTTSSSSAADIKIANIASQVASSLSSTLAAGPGGFTVSVSGQTILVKRTSDNNAFLMDVSDTATNENIYAVKDSIDKLTKLPTIAQNGFHVKLIGDSSTDRDDWYAKFTTTNTADTGIGAGYWKECAAPGSHTTFDKETMPHVLVREEDGTFTFREVDWGIRVAGDETNDPPPSFVGKTIERVDAKKRRLEFFAGNAWCMSRATDLFSFWPRSVQVVTDDDPIDVVPSYAQPFLLKGSAEFQSGLLLLSDTVQFIVRWGDTFGPKTISDKPLSTHSLDVRNGLQGLQQDRVVAALRRGDPAAGPKFTGLLAFRSPSQSLSEIIFDEHSAVVPTLIPGEAEWLAGSPTENVVAVKADGSDNLFVYKEAEDAGKIVQSAWFEWNFKNRVPVTGTFVGPNLYVVLRDSEGTHTMERISLAPFTHGPLTWDIYMDRRTYRDESKFEVSGGSTEVELPWTPRSGEQVYLVLTSGDQAGAVAKASAVVDDVATFPGIFEGPGYVGVAARATGTLSTQFFRKNTATGDVEVVTEGTLHLLRGWVSFAKSGPFKIVVAPVDREETFSEQVATPLFEDGGFTSAQDLQTGTSNFPIGFINDRGTISFDTEESPMPMRVGTFEWAGELYLPARPV